MIGYLNITGLKTALLLNFKYAKLGIKSASPIPDSLTADFADERRQASSLMLVLLLALSASSAQSAVKLRLASAGALNRNEPLAA